MTTNGSGSTIRPPRASPDRRDSPDPVESDAIHLLPVQDPTPVHNHGLRHPGQEVFRGEPRKDRTIRLEDAAVGPLQRLLDALGEMDLGDDLGEAVHRGRVVSDDRGAALHEFPRDRNGAALTDVVRSPFEGQAQEGDPPAGEAPELLFERYDGPEELSVVHPEDGLEQLRAVSLLRPSSDERVDVLREAGAPEADAGHEEFRIDARVEGEPLEHGVVFDAEAVAEIREFVREGDLRGEKGIRRVLDRFGGPQRRHEDRAVRGTKQIAQDPRGRGTVHSEDDSVWAQRILEGTAFAEELRIHGEMERDLCGLEYGLDDGLRRAGKHGALHSDGPRLSIPPGRRKHFRGIPEGAIVHAAVGPGRRPDAQEYYRRRSNRIFHSAGDDETLLLQDLP